MTHPDQPTPLTLPTSESSNVLSWIGAGFNVYGAYDLAASALRSKVFDPAKAPKGDEQTPFGRLPSYMAYRSVGDSDFFYASGEGRDSFQSKFAARAEISASGAVFSGHVEAAYGRQVAESSQYSFANVSFRDFLGNLVLERLDSRYLSDEFLAAVAALPAKAEPANLDAFSDFFQTFGAYFVTQISLGGTLEYYVAVQQSTSMEATEIQAKAEAEYKGLFVSGKASAEMSSDTRWERYRHNKTAVIRVKGGGDLERNLLSQVDPKSLDSMSSDTVTNYRNWLRSLSTNAAVMNFRLTGIWEVCGAKKKAVEDAFREYGKLMRPLLHIETRTDVLPADGYTPGVFLGGTLVPASPATTPYKGFGGFRLVVIDRSNPTTRGVRFSKLYNVPAGDGSHYGEVFAAMLSDLRGGGLLHRDNFLVLATYGAMNAFPPVPDFVRVLQECGAGSRLAAWLASAAAGAGTAHITGEVNYILVGIVESGPDAGVELLDLLPMPPTGRVRKTAILDLYFYGLGGGRPFVLGAADRK
ncbi:MAG: MAC/perforin domain-containing protein [Thermoanaerobaculia bacterium]|nr:MAC/perforin domain-containing protein [Thermoanaerobaculia bacterium]